VVIFFLKFEFRFFIFFLLYANRNCIVQVMASMYRIRIEGHGCCLKLPSLRWYVPKTAPRWRWKLVLGQRLPVHSAAAATRPVPVSTRRTVNTTPAPVIFTLSLDLHQLQPEELSTQLLLLWSLHFHSTCTSFNQKNCQHKSCSCDLYTFTRPAPASTRRTVNTTPATVIFTLLLELYQVQPEELSTQLLLLWSSHFHSTCTSFNQKNCQHNSCYCDLYTFTRPAPASTRRTVNTSHAPVLFTLSLDLHQLQPEELSTQLLLLWSLHFYSNSTSFNQKNCQHKSCYCPHTFTRPAPASTRIAVNTTPAPVIFTLSLDLDQLQPKELSIQVMLLCSLHFHSTCTSFNQKNCQHNSCSCDLYTFMPKSFAVVKNCQHWNKWLQQGLVSVRRLCVGFLCRKISGRFCAASINILLRDILLSHLQGSALMLIIIWTWLSE